ncbi:polysaccharide pyruvyl transferase family protein [Luteimicrobium album]|uniref:polysaccharide pyruvyl transferase family protein n=1 Tax=Luteimicrobium album TaxID=1054550 RepID=UPI0024E180C2|nr:polysaccharide pyruvyl transferase family protein [Luteimicrobium album]
MKKILIRSPQAPSERLDPITSTRRIGSNLGNLLYINGVYRSLSTESADITAGAFRAHSLEDPAEWLAKVNKRFDRFVVPMSNAFRVSFSEGLEGLTRIVEGLDMPVTVIGVGAQAPVDAVDPETGRVRMGRTGSSSSANDAKLERHDDVVRRFVKAVLERSESIGVRGPITQSYLVSLGFDADRVDVIGCPSLFTWGPGLRISKGRRPLSRRSRVSMNVDYRVAGMGGSSSGTPRSTRVSRALFRTLVRPVSSSRMRTRSTSRSVTPGHRSTRSIRSTVKVGCCTTRARGRGSIP